MCPCDLTNEYVCPACTTRIEFMYAALAVAERRGDDDQRQLRGQITKLGVKADIVKLRMEQRRWERENA